MKYVGIDYHKKYTHVTAVNEAGEVVGSKRLENKAEIFQEFFRERPVRRFWEHRGLGV